MSSTLYFAGDDELVVLTNTFELNGTPTDPATVTLTVTDPTGAQTVYSSTTRLSAGKYTQTVAATLAGLWSYEWDGEGSPADGQASDIDAGTWTVGTTGLNQFYCSNEQLKSRLGITDTADDLEITLAVQSACRGIDRITKRYFWQGPGTRTYVPTGIYDLEVDDFVSITQLNVDYDGDGIYETSWTEGTDYQIRVAPWKYNPTATGESWPYTGFNFIGPKYIPIVWPWSHLDRFQVIGQFGWPAVPLAVQQASLIAAADLFRMKDAPFGIAGYGEFAMRIQQNPRVMQLLNDYIKGDRVGV